MLKIVRSDSGIVHIGCTTVASPHNSGPTPVVFSSTNRDSAPVGYRVRSKDAGGCREQQVGAHNCRTIVRHRFTKTRYDRALPKLLKSEEFVSFRTLIRRQGNIVNYISKILFASSLIALSACAVPTGPPPEDQPVAGYSGEYRIGIGDTLNISVWREDDLSVTVPVRPDGKISTPLAGEIEVGDKTPEEVKSTITQRLSTYIRDPYVTVIVTNMGSDQYRSRVRVTGAVRAPLSAPYRQGMTVLDVVLEAGGLNEYANASKATLYRKNGDRIPIDLKGILNRGDMRTNYPLSPGDVVTVPERIF